MIVAEPEFFATGPRSPYSGVCIQKVGHGRISPRRHGGTEKSKSSKSKRVTGSLDDPLISKSDTDRTDDTEGKGIPQYTFPPPCRPRPPCPLIPREDRRESLDRSHESHHTPSWSGPWFIPCPACIPYSGDVVHARTSPPCLRGQFLPTFLMHTHHPPLSAVPKKPDQTAALAKGLSSTGESSDCPQPAGAVRPIPDAGVFYASCDPLRRDQTHGRQ